MSLMSLYTNKINDIPTDGINVINNHILMTLTITYT